MTRNVANRVHNGADIVDSRDIIERISELESQRTDAQEIAGVDEGDLWSDSKGTYDAGQWTEDDADELTALQTLAEQCEGYAADWRYGAALIRDTYFQEYAQDLAEDIGAIQRDASWPNNHIDWEAAADALKVDYTSVDWDGVEYWVRS